MTPSNNKTTGYILPQALAGLGLTIALALVPAFTHADTSLQVGVAAPNSSNEFNRTAFLTWTAEAGGTYKVQSSTNVANPAAWKTEDAVSQSTVGPIKWMAPEALRTQKYYRLILPQPEVLSVEPSFVNSDDPAALFYLTGQCLPTNGSVVINGLNFTPTLVDSKGGWMAISLNGLPPGTPITGSILVLDNASNVVTTLPLQNPVIYGTELTAEQLQGPPDEPPASPQALLGAWLSKRGYDYYKAKSDLNAAGLHSNPYFQENQNAGATPHGKLSSGAVVGIAVGSVVGIAGSGFGGADDSGEAGVVEGKKGINAVNVKLARTASGSATIAGISGGVVAGIVVACLSSGELQAEEIDFAIPGRGLDFAWTRTYRSRAEATTAQGAGWDFSFNVSATPQPDGTVVLRPGNGRADTFYPNGTNGWTRDEYFLHLRDVDQDGFPDEVVFPDGGKWLLHPPGTAFAGKLAQIVDRNNNAIRCEYDSGAGRLLRVVDTLDRTNTVAYTSKGLIESVTDFSGRTVRYEYDSAADLVACISPAVIGTPNGNDFPGGKTNRYAYSSGNLDQRLNHNLVSITDPKGQACLEVTYQATNNPAALDFDTVSSVLRGVDKKDIRRGMVIARPSNSFATVQTIVNDYVGNVSEYLFDSRQRCVSVREFTGRANPALPTTATENRPSGKLRPEDPDYFETRWEWNADSLCKREVGPGGQQVQCVYESDFDKSTPARKRADCRVVREIASGGGVDLDGDGVADTSERVWHYEYDPRFGSDPAARRLYSPGQAHWGNARLRSGVIAEVGAGRPATVGRLRSGVIAEVGAGQPATVGRMKHKGWDGLIYHRSAFCTAATDPRGNVTTATYDALGRYRVVFVRPSDKDAIDFAYNPSGQLTAITNAPDANGYRRVDTFSYYPSGWQAGYLQQCVEDAAGLALTSSFEYDARGNLTRYVDPRTNDWLFAYNSLDQLVQSSSATLSLCFCRIEWKYAYDANDNLVECTAPVFFDNPATATYRTDRFQYDPLHRVTEIALAVDATQARTNRFIYDGNGQCVQALGGDAVSGADPHQAVAYAYDERGLLFREIAAPGNPLQCTSQLDYDANGNPTRVSEGLEGTPSITTMEYDGFAGFARSKWTPIVPKPQDPVTYRLRVWQLMQGENATSERQARFQEAVRTENVSSRLRSGVYRLSKITDPMGNVTAFHCDANDNLKVVRHFGELNDVPGSAGNVRLAESRYEYDGLDRCVVEHDLHFAPATQTPVGDGECTTRIAFAPCGQCSSITDDLGQVTSFDYDTAGRVYSVRVPNGRALQVCVLDPSGNVTSVIQTDTPDLGGPAQVFSVTNVYDSLNRCVSSTDSAGNTSTCAYDSLDNPVSTVDARGNETVFAYDYLGRCVQTTCYQGKERGITINTSHVEYRLNSSGFSATDANSNTAFYACDSLDRLVAVTNADGTHRTLVWSPRGNLISEQDANGNVIVNTYDLNDRIIHRDIAARFETFNYDGCDRLTGHRDDDCDGDFTYDSHGNCVQEKLNGLATTSTYDALGNRRSLTYPGGRTLAYAYDANSRCTGITESGVALASFAYNGVTRLARVTYGNGTRTRIGYDGLTGSPNVPGDYGFGQVSRVRHERTDNSVAIDDRTFRFDPAQNKTSRDMTAPFTLAGVARAQTFEYDPACRLVASLVRTNGGQDRLVDYGLDRMGNRTNVTGAACFGDYTMDSGAPPADFQMNQYTTTGCDVRTYDDNGNIVARVSADGPVTYQYDYADRLVLVQALDSGTGTLAPLVGYAYDALGRRVAKTNYSGTLPPSIRQYCYDGACVIEERENGAVAASYALDDRGLLGLRLGGQDYFVHTDDQGNALALTGTGGAVVERYDYDDYGAVTFLTSDGIPTSATASAYGNAYCWGGLRLDAETGLHNDDGGGYFEPLAGRAVRGKVKTIKDMGNGRAAGNNPWSTGGGGGGPVEMKNGTVKFFNEAKGFGFIKEEGGQDSKHYITIPHTLQNSEKHYITIPHSLANKHYITIPHSLASKHYITIPHTLSWSSAAYGFEYLNKGKEYVGQITLMK